MSICVNIHTILEATETTFKRVNLKLGRITGAKQADRRSKGCFRASNRYLHMLLYVYFTGENEMIEFFKYWCREYRDADPYGKFLIFFIAFLLLELFIVLLLAFVEVVK